LTENVSAHGARCSHGAEVAASGQQQTAAQRIQELVEGPTMPGQEKIIKYEGSLCGCLASAHPAKDPSQLRCCQLRNQTAPPHEPDTEQKDCRPIPERLDGAGCSDSG